MSACAAQRGMGACIGRHQRHRRRRSFKTQNKMGAGAGGDVPGRHTTAAYADMRKSVGLCGLVCELRACRTVVGQGARAGGRRLCMARRACSQSDPQGICTCKYNWVFAWVCVWVSALSPDMQSVAMDLHPCVRAPHHFSHPCSHVATNEATNVAR